MDSRTPSLTESRDALRRLFLRRTVQLARRSAPMLQFPSVRFTSRKKFKRWFRLEILSGTGCMRDPSAYEWRMYKKFVSSHRSLVVV